MKNFREMTTKEKIRSLILYGIGIVFMPLGVVLTINAHTGAGGIDALDFIISEKLHVSTSIVIYALALLVVIITAIIRRGFPRITTFISSFFLGIFTDLWKSLLKGIEGSGIFSSYGMLILGMVIIAASVASYMISSLPTNPNDDFVVALTEKGWKVAWAKVLLDGTAVVTAFFLGGEIGIGTVIITLGLGPVIGFFHKYMVKFIVGSRKAEKSAA